MATFVATKPMKVGDEIRQPGELVPEASDWPDIRPWVGSGYLKEITDEEAARITGEKRTETKAKAESPTQDQVGTQGTASRTVESTPTRPRPIPESAKK